ncbi:hypothetical protein AUQ44_16655 [Vibrio cidicii]|uniref:DUF4760 domain-containing protein n=1 Tax=Vibrio cidicii TaxID=1763883 RepID=A0A151JD71_9VIBR|nr:DUF4760 domain-containing protein [Vibrio cidicii]KYN23606.1 hypothetical protein AUQ44_16655 [Vibrio cidicii]
MESSSSISASDFATIIAALVACITFIVTCVTYVISTNRERKIKTLDYWESAYSILTKGVESISRIHSGQWTSDIAQKKMESDINLKLIIDGLNMFEHLATGINLNIYDLKVVNKLGGKMLTDAYIAYAPLITEIERRPEYSNHFIEFKILYSKIDAIRKKAS